MINCRLAAYNSHSEAFTSDIFSALTYSAKNDPYAKPLDFSSHGDGWGYSILTYNQGFTSIHFYKTLTPVWRDRHKPPLTVKRSIGVLHARKASRGMPISAAETHPYTVELQDGTLLFIAQNGGVKKEPIIRILEEMGQKHLDPHAISDTHLLAKLLATIHGEKRETNLVELLREAWKLLEDVEAAGRCMNTAALALHPNDEAQLAIMRYIREDADEPLFRYCELYKVRDGPSKAVVSSTLADVLSQKYSTAPLGKNTILQLAPAPQNK